MTRLKKTQENTKCEGKTANTMEDSKKKSGSFLLQIQEQNKM